MKRRGQIWVSAVLYIALGMVVISLILSAGVPLINKMRDRNTIAQTKRVMFDLDNNIKAVANEAKGSTRFLSPVDINSGQLLINQGDSNEIKWSMTTNNQLIEPDIEFSEGDLNLKLQPTAIEGEYTMMLYLDYRNINVSLHTDSAYQNPFQGRFSFSIKNEYITTCDSTECPRVSIRVT